MYRQLDQMGFQVRVRLRLRVRVRVRVSPSPGPHPNPNPDPKPKPNPKQSGEEFVIAAREAEALGATLLLGEQVSKSVRQEGRK